MLNGSQLVDIVADLEEVIQAEPHQRDVTKMSDVFNFLTL